MKTLQEWQKYIQDHIDVYLGTVTISISDLNNYIKVIKEDVTGEGVKTKTRYCKWIWLEDEDYYDSPHPERDIDMSMVMHAYNIKNHPYCSVCGKKIKLVKEKE